MRYSNNRDAWYHFFGASFACAMCAGAGAQTSIFSNAGPANEVGLATGPYTDSGAMAPNGCVWSELQDDSVFSANSMTGVAAHALGDADAYRVADNFMVVGQGGWRVDYASFYVFQPGGSESVSPFSGVTVRIWRGRPGEGGVVVWGDLSTDRFVSAEATNMYRVFHSTMPPFPPAPDTTRRIWRVVAGLGGVVLAPGEYWIDWQFSAVSGSGEAFCPPITIAGRRGRDGGNAIQWRPTNGGEWVGVIDDGKPSTVENKAQELPFILAGTGSSCGPDFDHDGFLTGVDFDQFVAAFESGDMRADYDSDGFLTGTDFDAFVQAYEAGC